METFVISALIVVSTGYILWEIRCLPARVVDAINEDDAKFAREQIDNDDVYYDDDDGDLGDIDEAVGESVGVPMIIAVMRRERGKHPNVRCGLCNNLQCLTCNGRECVKCGMEIQGDPE